MELSDLLWILGWVCSATSLVMVVWLHDKWKDPKSWLNKSPARSKTVVQEE